MGLKLVTADERMRETSGVKCVIFGPAKIGKTTLLRTVDAPRTLVLNIEAGDLAVRDVPYQELRPEDDAAGNPQQWTWPELRNIAAFLGGPNPAKRSDEAYSADHHAHVAEQLAGVLDLASFDLLFIDSITVASRVCFSWCLTQPEAFNKHGQRDTRGAYGVLKREMVAWITQLQHAKRKHVVFLGLLDQVEDDHGRKTWAPQMEGQATGNALLGIVDQVITMQRVDFGDGNAVRCFITQQGNPWGFPAGDRCGKLDQIEEPHLGKLLAKCTDPNRQRAAVTTQAPDTNPQPTAEPVAA